MDTENSPRISLYRYLEARRWKMEGLGKQAEVIMSVSHITHTFVHRLTYKLKLVSYNYKLCVNYNILYIYGKVVSTF